jgi:hypothetical protein
VSQFRLHAEALRPRPKCRSLPWSVSNFTRTSWVAFVRMHQHLFQVVRPPGARISECPPMSILGCGSGGCQNS